MNEQGKSLVELVMVVGLVGLMVAMTGQSLVAATARQQGHTVAVELANELRAARYLALIRREPMRVVFEPGEARIRVESAAVPGQPIREYDFKKKGVTVERLTNGPAVVFYPSGRAASATTITLRNARQERWQLTVSLVGRISQI
jgi:type IV fimbrial biogenesis protein FimT